MIVDHKSGIPLIGCIAFGCIDRGTNLLQVRPTSTCNLYCPFCSTNANNPKVHPVDYEVELSYLISWFKRIAEFKDCKIEANIDSVGEIATYPRLIELVKELSKIKNVYKISMQTNGTLLTKEKIRKLEKAGLNQINLSINSLDKNLAKFLAGSQGYDVDKIIELAGYISRSRIKLLLAPVWLPRVNDDEIVKIIKLSKKLKAMVGIQKYELYKYGRKLRKAKHLNWWKFFKQLEEWEKEFDVKLKVTAKDLNVVKCKSLPSVFDKNEIVYATIKAPGWIKGQMIGVAKDRCVSINNCNRKINDKVKIKILENKNNIYVAELK